MLAEKVSKGILSVGVWTITRVLVSALATPFFSRILGTDGYGDYAYYLALTFLAVPLASAGTLQTLSKYISESADPLRRARVARLASVISLAGFVIVGTAVTIVLLRGGTATPPWALNIVLLLCIGFDVLWFYARGILYGLHREERAGIPGAIASVLGTVVSVVMALLGYGLIGVFSGLLLGNAFMSLVALRAARQLLPGTRLQSALTSSDPRPREVLWFALSTMVYTSLSMVLYKSGIVVVHHLTGNSTSTGLYATGLQMAEFVWVFIIAVEGVMVQATSRLWMEGRMADLAIMVSRMLRYVSVGTAFILLYVLVFAEDLIVVYFGPRFADAAPVLQLLVPGVFSYSLARLLGPVLHARGSVLTLAVIVGTSACLNILLCFLLIPWLGISGAGISTSIAYGIVMLPYVLLLRRRAVHVFQGFAPQRQLLLGILAGAVMLIVSLTPWSPPVRLIVGGVAGGISFFVLALRIRVLRVPELVAIVDSLPGAARSTGRRLIDRLEPFLTIVAGGSRP